MVAYPVSFSDYNINKSFDKIVLSIASPADIIANSHGEVKTPETINYRTLKPEIAGLFCEQIFGPVKDYECRCGKYKRIKNKGTVCEKCGVEVTESKVRRDRMGHIKLAAPVAHIWFLKSLPSRIATLIDITLKDIEKVLYFDAYIVTDPGITPFSYGQLLMEEEYNQALENYGNDAFKALIGAEAIQEILSNIDLEKERVRLRREISETNSEAKLKKLMKQLKLVEDFINSGARPEWMVLEVLPVLPPDLRPLVMLDGGRFATSDLNDLYRRVINRNNRLARLIELKAPDIIIRNEKRMLQQSVDSLFDNGRSSGKSLNNKRPLKSLSDMLKGKTGRFRQNLLGKRVDYSGRSVIVVGPTLKLHQCGLPKEMALELFKPFVYAKLELYGHASTVRTAKKIVEKKLPEVWDALEEVIKEHPVLLNRAPTLHRLGIQAFEPLLVEGKAIQLHPLVCTAFNADFDGDQMAVHVPLSIEAQLEARVLMMSTNNILNPSSGKPIIVPSQDIVLGLYYSTLLLEGRPGENKLFADLNEVKHALESKVVEIHSKIRFGIKRNGSMEIYTTTPGRVLLYEILPEENDLGFECVNRLMTKKETSNLMDFVYRRAGQKAAVIFADQLMQFGFKRACLSGVSIGKDDMVIPETKDTHISEAEGKVLEFEKQYSEGLITAGERYNKVIDTWSRCTEKVAEDMMKAVARGNEDKQGPESLNSIYMMSHSGARGSAAQIKQLAGMRGLMAKPSGEIMENPILSNFKEGLTVLEYFNSTHGTRKGLADTALKTANSGYLTRRLVDVSQDCIVNEDDCGTDKGLEFKAIIEGSEVIVALSERILGRVCATDIHSAIDDRLIAKRNTLIDEELAAKIEESGVDSVKVRSPLTCETNMGVCAKCYGRDLATGDLVSTGEAVGVIAAQSIGEPGTQLTMRTFHVGGAATKGVEISNIESPFEAVIKLSNVNYVTNKDGQHIVLSRSGELVLYDDNQNERARYKLPHGSKLYYNNGDKVVKGDRIAEWDPYTGLVISDNEGYAVYKDLVEGISIREVVDEETGISSKVVTDWKQQSKTADLKPRIELVDEKGNKITNAAGNALKYYLPANSFLSVSSNQKIGAGDIIARIPRETSKTKDITGGLPRVAELFEARKPKEYAIMSEIEGIVEFGKDYKNKRRIVIKSEKGDFESEYLIPKGKHIAVSEGEYIRKGELITDGSPVPHDILKIMGIEALSKYIVQEIQQVYRLQGVKIDDKHIEIILRQMLQKIEIVNTGDNATLLVGDQIDRFDFIQMVKKAIERGEKPASGVPVLQGITKASLQTRSFISAASFQETTRVLTEAAVAGKADYLHGLKENVIVGRLIPAGTGFITSKYKKLARRFDLDENVNISDLKSLIYSEE